MPVGVFVDCLCVLAGALIGCFLGKLLPEEMKRELNILLGFCSVAIGITSIIKVSSMAPVVFAVMIGYIVGAVMKLEQSLTGAAAGILKWLPLPQQENFSMDRYVTVLVLFCCSGFGIYATFVEAMSGDSSILLSKAVLDMMTAMIFAADLRYAVAIVPIPMLVVLLLMSGIGRLIAPAVSQEMLLNFMACGGILTLAAGLRVADIKKTAITNLIPALVMVMPLTYLWQQLPL